MTMKGAIFHMIKKEFIELRRMRLLALLLVAPIIQVIVFGYVATTDVKHVKTMICDEDATAMSRQLADKFEHTEYFDPVMTTHDPSEIDRVFAANGAIIGIRVPEHFSRDVKKGGQVKIQLIVDGSDSNMSLLSMDRAISIIGRFSQDRFGEKMEIIKKAIGGLPSVNAQERVWFNPELESANTMVPGVVGLILMIVTLAITAVAIVREKETGNIEQLVVTPIKPYEIILGKIIPYIVVGLIDVATITVLSLVVFKISMQGSLILLLALSFFMILANLGLGILVSTVSATQQQAMLSAIFFVFPNILLSGFIFPIKNMPEVLQWVTYLVPMRYYIVIIRGVFLKGLTFMELLPQTAALFVFGVVLFSIAIRQFRKTIG